MDQPLPRSTDIILPVSGNDGEELHQFDVQRAARQVYSSVKSGKTWIQDVRWFALPLGLLMLTGLALSIWAMVVDSNTWPIFMLMFLSLVVVLIIYGSTLFATQWLSLYKVAFYLSVAVLVCVLVVLLLVLTNFFDELHHNAGAVLLWGLVAVLILEMLSFVHLTRALASIRNAELIVHQHVCLARDIKLLSLYTSAALPPVSSAIASPADAAIVMHAAPKKRD